MTDYLFRLEVPADKRSFTVAEALDATSEAIHPDPGTGQPVMILSIDKVVLPAGSGGMHGRRTALNDADWDLLRLVWSRLDAPEFPMPLERWQTYLDAFTSSRNKPEGWALSALQRDPRRQCDIKRAAALHDHKEALRRAVRAGAIALKNPLTGAPYELGWLAQSDKWLLTRGDLKALCDMLSIELVTPPSNVPHFVTSARPTSVPPDLLVIAPDAWVTWASSIGGVRGSGRTYAGEYRDAVKETIARQAEGYFTLEEAAQVLADSRPGLDTVKTMERFRLAHSKGELPIHQRVSRFPLEVGETISGWDLLDETELDAWMRASVGYGFPSAEGASLPTLSARAAVTPEPAPDRGRRVKRAALIADNVRRWPTIERDLKDGATNGLSEAARDSAVVGWWWEGSAIEWARARAKVRDVAPGLASTTFHRTRD